MITYTITISFSGAEELACGSCKAVVNISMKAIQGAIQSSPTRSAEIVEKELDEKACPLLQYFVYEDDCKRQVSAAIGEIEKIGEVADFSDFSEGLCTKLKVCKAATPVAFNFMVSEQVSNDVSKCSSCQAITSLAVDKLYIPGKEAQLLDSLDSLCDKIPESMPLRERCHSAIQSVKDLGNPDEKVKELPELLCMKMRVCESMEKAPVVTACEACTSSVAAPLKLAVDKAAQIEQLCKFVPAFLYDSCIEKSKEGLDIAEHAISTVPQLTCKQLQLC
eukprot:Awhi_evm1s11697